MSKTYEVAKVLKKQVLGEFKGICLEDVKKLVDLTFPDEKNIIIYEVPPKDGEVDV